MMNVYIPVHVSIRVHIYIYIYLWTDRWRYTGIGMFIHMYSPSEASPVGRLERAPGPAAQLGVWVKPGRLGGEGFKGRPKGTPKQFWGVRGALKKVGVPHAS